MGISETPLDELYEEDPSIEQLERLLVDSKNEIEVLLKRSQHLEGTLADIQDSMSWKVVSKLAVSAGMIAPLGTRRRRALRFGYRCVGAVPKLRSRRWVAYKARTLLNSIRDIFDVAMRSYPTKAKRLDLLPRGRTNLPSTLLRLPTFDKVVVSIIIPVFNHWSETFACLESIGQFTDGPTYEVIVAIMSRPTRLRR